MLISAIQDCVYTFFWLTAAACPLNVTQHDNCMVNNPATGPSFEICGLTWRPLWSLLFNNPVAVPTGYLFDLNSLAKDGGYTVYSQQEKQKMFRLNICNQLADSVCGANAGMSGVLSPSPYSVAAPMVIFALI